MSEQTEGAAPGAEAAPAVTTPAPTQPAPVSTSVTPDPFDDAKVTQFGRDYVEKLRQEAAGHRTAAAPFKDAFGDMSESDRAVFLQLAQTYRTDPAAAAKQFQELGGDLEKALTPAQENALDQAQDGQEKPLTQSQVQKILQEHDQEQAVARETEKILAKVQQLGYTPGSPQHREVLFFASQNGGDIEAAHKAVEKGKQDVIDAYLTGKKSQPRPVAGVGATPASPGQPVKSFADARASLAARLAQG